MKRSDILIRSIAPYVVADFCYIETFYAVF